MDAPSNELQLDDLGVAVGLPRPDVEAWLGESLDVSAIDLDDDNRSGSPYFEVKLLCNEEDLAGAPVAPRGRRS